MNLDADSLRAAGSSNVFMYSYPCSSRLTDLTVDQVSCFELLFQMARAQLSVTIGLLICASSCADQLHVPTSPSTQSPSSSIAAESNHNKNSSVTEQVSVEETVSSVLHLCPPLFYACSELPAYCLTCDFNTSCVYGSNVTVSCRPTIGVLCRIPNYAPNSSSPNAVTMAVGQHTNYSMIRNFICRYCHQLNDTEVFCIGRGNCRQTNVPRSFYETLCEPHAHTLCLGRRVFRRMATCNWSSGKSYLVTVLLSLFFGGFGADRFYLGMWMEGLGKLFSFGGLGIWSIVDFVLILAGYVKPPDDAVY
ncbi:TM2 domain protein, partial [Opisthorchis viverrini]